LTPPKLMCTSAPSSFRGTVSLDFAKFRCRPLSSFFFFFSVFLVGKKSQGMTFLPFANSFASTLFAHFPSHPFPLLFDSFSPLLRGVVFPFLFLFSPLLVFFSSPFRDPPVLAPSAISVAGAGALSTDSFCDFASSLSPSDYDRHGGTFSPSCQLRSPPPPPTPQTPPCPVSQPFPPVAFAFVKPINMERRFPPSSHSPR